MGDPDHRCTRCRDTYSLRDGCEPTAYCDDCAQALVEKYESAIRAHRDQVGHDRCRLDDDQLYAALPEGKAEADTTLPPKDDFVAGWAAYWERRNGGVSHDHCSLVQVLADLNAAKGAAASLALEAARLQTDVEVLVSDRATAVKWAEELEIERDAALADMHAFQAIKAPAAEALARSRGERLLAVVTALFRPLGWRYDFATDPYLDGFDLGQIIRAADVVREDLRVAAAALSNERKLSHDLIGAAMNVVTASLDAPHAFTDEGRLMYAREFAEHFRRIMAAAKVWRG